MRILKKSLALLLALTMVLSLVAINVSADGTAIINFSKDKKLATNEVQTVDIVVSIQNDAANAVGALQGVISYDTDNLTLTNVAAATENAAAGYTHMHNAATKKAMVFNATDLSFPEEKNLFVLTFEIKANPAVGTYAINFVNDDTLKIGTATGTSLKDSFTINAGEIEIYETKTITAFTPAAATIKYGADAEAVAAAFAGKKATGTGTTSSSAPVSEEFDVTWAIDGFDTTPETLANATVNGTVAAIDGYTFNAQPTATVTFAKADAGFTVAPAAYSTKAVKDGAELTEIADIVEWIIAKDDKPATTTVTIAAEGAAVTDVTFDWDNATKADADDTLKTGIKDDTIVLNVPVVATDASNAFYTLSGEETAEVTITILAAEIAVEAITIEDTTANAKPTVKATIPAGELKTGEAEVKVQFLNPATEEVVHTVTETVTAEADQATEISVKSDKRLTDMGFKTAGDVFAVKVLVNDANLKVGEALQVEGKVMVTFSDAGSIGGIGVSQGNVSEVVPPTQEPGTDEPGTEEPGTEEPGTEEPVDPSAPIEGAPFEDITVEFAWAAESITTLKELGVINGNEDGNFEPDADITRAEFTKMVAVLFGLEIGAVDTEFADCAADAWYTPYIAAANAAGFINGVNDAEFAPDATITREQACTILARALKVASETEVIFVDGAEIEDYAKAAIAALVEMGIVNGYENGTFAPANNITRAEAAKIMAGAYGKMAPAEEVVAE